jgi:hypothetical protein
MSRIQPECFIEYWKGVYTKCNSEGIWKIENLKHCLGATEALGYTTLALFLIKPQSTTLAERLEARKVNNPKNP